MQPSLIFYRHFFRYFPLAILFLVMASCSDTKLTEPPTQGKPTEIPHIPSSDNRDNVQSLYLGQDLRFENISLEHGLSQSTIFSIIQDQQGYLWFGTEDGLNKYDGYNFTVYKHDPEDPNSIVSNWIQVIYKDNLGNLWLGTPNGLDVFDPEREIFTHLQHDPENPSSIGTNQISTIIQDRNNYFWIGTSDGGVNRYDPENDNFVYYRMDPKDSSSLSSDSVTTLFEDSKGIIWAGTRDKGLNVYQPQADSWLRIAPEPGTHTGLRHGHISAILEDENGALWIGMEGGGISKLALSDEQREQLFNGNSSEQPNLRFQTFSHDPDQPTSLSSNDVVSLFRDPEGLIWIGTRTGGLNIYLPGKGTFRHFRHSSHVQDSLGYDWIQTIYQDKEGVFWFGTIGGGINKLKLGWKNFPLYRNIPNNENSLGDDMVRAFHQDQDSLWIGTMFGGVDRLDLESGVWDHYRNYPEDPGSLSSNFVSHIYQDSSDTIWIGTTNGLDRYDPITESYSHYLPNPEGQSGSFENNIRAIYENPTGHFWIGTREGLYQFDLENNNWSQPDYSIPGDPHDLRSFWIISFLKDHQDSLWISTWGAGLFRIDRHGKISHFHHDPDDPTSISSDALLIGYLDSRGDIWFSTPRGLNKLNPVDETFTRYLIKDGLPNDTVYCVLEDNLGNLWMSTNNGISKFDPHDGIFYNYDRDDGLQSNEFNGNSCLVGNSGELMFGGINGFNLFYPDQISQNSYKPPVVLSSFRLNGEEIDLEQDEKGNYEITLNWPDNAFEFEYAALSYNQPEKNQYAYFLQGFERDWNEVGSRRHGQYTNIPGGTYTLRIKGSNDDDVWNEEGKAVNITVVPPFWGTWWFRGLVVTIVIGLGYGGFRLRVNNLEKRARELESQVKEQTQELVKTQAALQERELEQAVNDERSRLARELHDSVTQSLYSLTLFTEAARHVAEQSENDEIEGYVSQIGSIGLQALKEMRLLVYELRPPVLEEEGLINALRIRLKAVEGRAGVDTQVIAGDPISLGAEAEGELFMIAQEALNNSLKHAEASSIIVTVRQQKDSFEMEIVDDGIGFDPDKQKNVGGMGLKNIQDRAKRIDGIVSILSSPKTGTTIKVIIKDIDE